MIRSLRVLHVEDDFADAMLLQQALGDAGAYNFELEVVRTLHDARYKLARREFDLIIADLRLPDSTNPNATVALLKKHADGAPILVLTGSAGVDSDKIGEAVTVLDKNVFFHNRDDRKSRILLERVLEAAENEDGGDALIL